MPASARKPNATVAQVSKERGHIPRCDHIFFIPVELECINIEFFFLQNRIMRKQNLNGLHKALSLLQEVLKDSKKWDLQIVHTAQLAESVRIKVGIVAIIMKIME
uniref:Uncharacterized protein n=1 Tax=Glossina austeni TaxID=7395 RepID=A0A1A9V4V6_GLOAU